MTWDRKNDRYLPKFRLNLYKKLRGILSGADLDEEFLQDCSIPISKRNVLSVACQFYDPTGLPAPLMFCCALSVQWSLPGSPMFHEFCTVWSPCYKILHCCRSNLKNVWTFFPSTGCFPRFWSTFFRRQSARLWFLCLHLFPEHGQPVVQYCKSDGKVSFLSS